MFEDLFIVENKEASNGIAQPLGKTNEISDVNDVDEIPVLHDRKEAAYERQQEMPWHRIAVELSAKGYTCREIALRIGCSDVAVQDIIKQKRYQKDLVQLIRKETTADQEVLELVKGNVVKAVKTLKEIMEDSKQSAAYRIAAAKELLDRRYGKPNQPVNRNTDVDLSNLSDADLAKIVSCN